MASYDCKRCGVSFSLKHHLKQHLQRKNQCLPILSNVVTNLLMNELYEDSNRVHKCNYCDKAFTCTSSKYRHQRSCKEEKGLNPKPKVKAPIKQDTHESTKTKKEVNQELRIKKLEKLVDTLKAKKSETFWQSILEDGLGCDNTNTRDKTV